MRCLRVLLSLLLSLTFPGPLAAGVPKQTFGPVVERELPLGKGEWQVGSVLTMPGVRAAGGAPAVLLLPGSGPADRDMAVGPNRLFRDISQSFARNGIATLRFDKRLVVHADLFRQRHMLPTIDQEYLDDAVEGVEVLRRQPASTRTASTSSGTAREPRSRRRWQGAPEVLPG